MKLFLLNTIIVLFLAGCKSKLQKSVSPDENHPYFYIAKAKNRDCTITTRISYLNEAARRSLTVNNDSVLIKALSYKAFLFREQKNLDSTIKSSQQMLYYASKYKDSNQIGRAYFKIGEYFNDLYIKDSAFYYLDQSKTIFEAIGDTIEANKMMNGMSRILIDNGNYDLAERLLVKALGNAKKKNDSTLVSSVYHYLSIIYRDRFDYQKASNYIDLALSFNENQKKEDVLENSKLLILQKEKKYDQAIQGYKTLLQEKRIKQNRKQFARMLDNLSHTKWLRGDQHVLQGFNEALRIRDSVNDTSGMIASYVHLLNYHKYLDTGLAIQYANLLLALTIKQHNIKDRLEALEYLSEAINAPDNPYIKMQLQLKDSILKSQRITGSKYASLIYNSEENEIKYLEEKRANEINNQKRITQSILYIALLVLLLSTSLFIFFFMKMNHQKEKIKIAHQTEIKISKTVHDEIANDIYLIMNGIDRIDIENKTFILDKIEDIYNRTRDISRANSFIDTGDTFINELKGMLSLFGNKERTIIIKGGSKDLWARVSTLKKIEIYRILQELMTNMKKHSEASLVVITFSRKNKRILITYSDNGIGVEVEKIINNGLRNVENRISSIKGLLKFDKEAKKGTRILLSFPS